MRSRIPAILNVLKAWLLLVGACGVLGGIGFAAAGYRGLSILVFCVLMLAGAAYWYGDRIVLGMVGARELPLGEAPLLHSTVERLATVAGVAKPKLYVITDGLPRALATGRGPRGSALALSTGLIAAASPAELEAVIAHELAHVRSRDVAVQTSVVVLAATLQLCPHRIGHRHRDSNHRGGRHQPPDRDGRQLRHRPSRGSREQPGNEHQPGDASSPPGPNSSHICMIPHRTAGAALMDANRHHRRGESCSIA